MAEDKITLRIINTLQKRLSATGIPQQKAISASVSAVGELQEQYGGQRIYLSRQNYWTNRNQAIRRDFDGRNLADVCEKWNVSRATVYRITKK